MSNPVCLNRMKLAQVFALVAALWLAIGLWGYRHERFRQGLNEGTARMNKPALWAEMPRQAVSDEAAPRWGMNFSPSLLPLDRIFHGGPGKDGVPALSEPHFVSVGQAGFMKPGEMVIGVSLGGQARAWPLSIMQYHEVVNDTLAGQALVVIFNPLSGAAMVFSRLSGGEVRNFGTSGLFYESAPLIYDRQALPREESLWSPVLMRAVCGPAAGRGFRLELIDADLMNWSGWVRLHPETTVLSRETGFEKPYPFPSESRYLMNDYPMMPVSERTGRRPDLRNKDEVVVVQAGQTLKAYPMADFKASEDGTIVDEVDGQRLTLVWDEASGRVHAEAGGLPDPALARAYSYWFIWDAHYPEGAVYRGREPGEPVNSESDRLRR